MISSPYCTGGLSILMHPLTMNTRHPVSLHSSTLSSSLTFSSLSSPSRSPRYRTPSNARIRKPSISRLSPSTVSFPLFPLLLVLLLYLPISVSSLGITNFPTPTSPTLYTEHSIPVPLCPNITIDSGTYSIGMERIPSKGITLTIPTGNDNSYGGGYVSSSDILYGYYLAIDFVWETVTNIHGNEEGRLTLQWNENRPRAYYTLTEALRSIQFQSYSDNPTLYGTCFLRSILLSVQDIDNHVVYQNISVKIIGRNDPPFMPTSTVRAPPISNVSSLPVLLFREGNSLPTLLFPPGSVRLTDADDYEASRAVITLRQNFTGDTLSYTDPTNGLLSSIQSTWNSTTKTLTLYGTTSFENYVLALTGIGFLNILTTKPILTTRRIEVRFWDAGVSQPGIYLPTILPTFALINVTAINNAPFLFLPNVTNYNISLISLNITAGTGSVPLLPTVQIIDDDDVSLSLVMVWISSGYIQGQDEILLPSHLLPSLDLKHLRYFFNSSTGVFLLEGKAPLSTYERVLQSIAFRNTRRAGASIAQPRIVSISVRDSASDEEDSGNYLYSPWVNISVTLSRLNNAPVFIRKPQFTRLAIEDKSPFGTPVHNGILTALDEDPDDIMVYEIVGGNDLMYFYLDSTTATLYVNNEIDLNILGKTVTIDIQVRDRTDPNDPLIRTTVATYTIDIIDLNMKPQLANGLTPATVPPVYYSRNSLPPDTTVIDYQNTLQLSRLAFIHNRRSYVCIDYRTMFSLGSSYASLNILPSSVLQYELEFIPDAQHLNPIDSTPYSVSLNDTRLQSLFATDYPFTYFPTLTKGIYCLSGLPQYGPSLRLQTNQTIQSPIATSLRFRTIVYVPVPLPNASIVGDGNGGRRNTSAVSSGTYPRSHPWLSFSSRRPIDTQLILSHDWSLTIDIAGCTDPAARYVPCYRKGIASDKLGFGIYIDNTPCDNDCYDGDGNGICDNLCDLHGASIDTNYSTLFPHRPSIVNGFCTNPIQGYGNLVYSSAAANPGGNYNPYATTTDDQVCVYPHRTISVNFSIATMDAPATYSTVGTEDNDNTVTGVRKNSHQILIGTSSTPPLFMMISPYVTTNDPSIDPSIPLSNRSYGTATLRIPHGIIDQLVTEPFSGQPRSSTGTTNTNAFEFRSRSVNYYGNDGSLYAPGVSFADLPEYQQDSGTFIPDPNGPILFPSSLYDVLQHRYGTFASSASSTTPTTATYLYAPPAGGHNLTMAFAFHRFEWPNTEPLPPFSLSSAGPLPAIDADLMFRILPAGVRLPSSTVSPPEVCIYAGPAATSVAMNNQLDPTKRRYPRIYTSDITMGSKKAWVHLVSSSLRQAGIGLAATLDRSTVYSSPFTQDTTPSSSTAYTASSMDPSTGYMFSPWIELSPSLYDPDTGKLCAFLNQKLPTIVAIGWSGVPYNQQTSSNIDLQGSLPGSSIAAVTARITDINTEINDSLTYGDSSPAWLTPYANRLFFTATSGPLHTGRELWSIGPPTVSPWYYSPEAVPDNDVLLSNRPYRVRQPDKLASKHYDALLPSLVGDIYVSGYPSAFSADPGWLTVYRGPGEGILPRLYFAATTPLGRELWMYDAYLEEAIPAPVPSTTTDTASTTTVYPRQTNPRLFMDILPGASSSNPEWLTVYDSSLYFVATDYVGMRNQPSPIAYQPRRELWLYHDTRGTATKEGLSIPQPLADLRGYWSGGNAQQEERIVFSGYTNPSYLTVCGPHLGYSNPEQVPMLLPSTPELLFFTADSNTGINTIGTGNELWAYNASSRTYLPSIVMDIAPGPLSSTPEDLVCWNGGLWFTAEETQYGREIYRTSFVLNTDQVSYTLYTERLSDINPGPPSSFPGHATRPAYFVPFLEQLYFVSYHPDHGTELWTTGLGTNVPGKQFHLVTEILRGTASTNPSDLVVYHDILYFACDTVSPYFGRELCGFDGLSPGYVVADLDTSDPTTPLSPSTPSIDGSSSPSTMRVWADRLFFVADDGISNHGRELYMLHTDPRHTREDEPTSSSSSSSSSSCASLPVNAFATGNDESSSFIYGKAVDLSIRQCGIRLTPSPSSSSSSTNLLFGTAVAIDKGTVYSSPYDENSAEFIPWMTSPTVPYASSLSPTDALPSNKEYLRTNTVKDTRPIGMRTIPNNQIGGKIIAVGAPGANKGAGLVYIFVPLDTVSKSGEAYRPGSTGISTEELYAHSTVQSTYENGPNNGLPYSYAPTDGWYEEAVLGSSVSRTEDLQAQPYFPGDGLGYTVSVTGGGGDLYENRYFVASGAPLANLQNKGSRSGAVYVWERRPFTSSDFTHTYQSSSSEFRGYRNHSAWSEAISLLPDNVGEDFYYGTAVGAYGNVVVVGAPGAYQEKGTAYVWVRSSSRDGGTWTLFQELTVPSTNLGGKGILQPGDRYGCSVAIDFSIIVIGACGNGKSASVNNTGTVYLWTWDPYTEVWMIGNTNRSVLTPPLSSLSSTQAYRYGAAVSVHGNYLAVGAPLYPAQHGKGTNNPIVSMGATFVYVSDGSGLPIGVARILSSDMENPGSGFGTSVGITSYPMTIIVGAPDASIGGSEGLGGVAMVLEPIGTSPALWHLQGNREEDLLTLTGRLRPTDTYTNDYFGSSIGISGSIAVIGTPLANSGTGSIYVTTCTSAMPCAVHLGEYTAATCTAGHNQQCQFCTSSQPCPQGTYESSPCTSTHDRICTPCTTVGGGEDGNEPCPFGYRLFTECSPTTDRLCVLVDDENDHHDISTGAHVDEQYPFALPASMYTLDNMDNVSLIRAHCVRQGTCTDNLPEYSSVNDPFVSSAYSLSPSIDPTVRTRTSRSSLMHQQQKCIYREFQALRILYEVTNGKYWRDSNDNTVVSWKQQLLQGTDPCRDHWSGIQCSLEGHIISLRLPNYGLQGTLPPYWGEDLPYLQILDLSMNSLTSLVPVSLGTHGRYLRIVNLASNQFGGTVPLSFTLLTNLEELSISGNDNMDYTEPVEVYRILRERGVRLDV